MPTLTESGGVAFMRFKRPQSPYLSRVLRQKMEQHDKRVMQVDDMQDLVDMGRLEEEWDRVLEKETGLEGREEGGAWVRDLLGARDSIKQAMGRTARKNKEHGDKLVEIWEREVELAKAEGFSLEDRKREKIQIREERKLARRAEEARIKESRKAAVGSGSNTTSTTSPVPNESITAHQDTPSPDPPTSTNPPNPQLPTPTQPPSDSPAPTPEHSTAQQPAIPKPISEEQVVSYKPMGLGLDRE